MRTASLGTASLRTAMGESTTIALLARISGLLNPLRTFIKTKPVWWTCAGAILLAQSVVGAKRGGQELLGGMSITMGRNAWGSQVESFEADLRLEVPGLRNPEVPFKGVFIRAPVVLDFGVGEPISVVARLPLHAYSGTGITGGLIRYGVGVGI